MAPVQKKGPSRRDWISMTAAGVILGLTFGLACSAVFGHLPHGIAPPIAAQLTMWIVLPIWLSVAASAYWFQTGKRAWTWLGAANAVAVILALLTRLL